MARNDADTIVVIDDDDHVSGVLGGLLEIFGYQVKTYSSARNFIDQSSGIKAGCIVVDQNMPDMSGLELVARMTREHHAVPTVLITGAANPELARQAKQLGVTKVLQKPMSHTDLLNQIEACLAM